MSTVGNVDNNAPSPACEPPAAGEHSPHRILRNSTLNIAGQGINAVAYVVAVVVLARALGKEGVGHYFLVYALTLAVQLVMEGGLSTTLTCRMAREPHHGSRLMAEAAGLFLVVSILSAAVLLAMGAIGAWAGGGADYLGYFAFAAGTCVALQVQRYCAGVYRSMELFRLENFARALQGTLFAGGATFLVVSGRASVAAALASLMISQIVASFVLVCGLVARFGWPGMRLRWKMAQQWLMESVPLGAGDVIRELTWQLGTILLGILQPAAVVGIYSMAFRPLGPLNWLPLAVLNAAFPSYSRLAANDPERLKAAFGNSVRLLWILSIPIAVAMFVCAKPLILLVGGPEFLEAVLPLRLLIWISVLSYLSIQFRFLFMSIGQQHRFVRLVALVFAIELLAGLAMIPFFGYLGACAGSLIGEMFYTVAGLWTCRREGITSIDWLAMLWAAVGGVVMALVAWPVRNEEWTTLLPAVAISAAVYFGFCVIVRAVRTKEVVHLFRALTAIERSAA
jgi:O-antigen/teichoic acid export membrane protein